MAAAAASNLSHFQWLLYVKEKRNEIAERGEKDVATEWRKLF